MTGQLRDLLRRALQGRDPYEFQVEVGELLLSGGNVVLRAPTGSGKTVAALVPFVQGFLRGRYSRLIYALPLRTLVRSIAREAAEVVGRLGAGLSVTTQTGEQPDDPFFARGDIVVCTYDQLLSGLLADPYSLSDRQANVNAACIAGAMVVFDEFHLMELDRAFLTACACLGIFRGLTQSLWLSATATEPLVDELGRCLDATTVEVEKPDWAEIPSIARVRRLLRWSDDPLTPEAVLAHRGKRVIAILNRVDWARELYERIPDDLAWPKALLHSRFFRVDRDKKEQWVLSRFGPGGKTPGLVVCTQVIEAGVDITSDVLLTQLAPMNALVQRAGRCARFPPSSRTGVCSGVVIVHELPEEDERSLPYEADVIDRTRDLVRGCGSRPKALDPAESAKLVQEVHGVGDGRALEIENSRKRTVKVMETIRGNALGGVRSGAAYLIRDASDNVRVILACIPPETPAAVEPVTVTRGSVRRLLQQSPAVESWAYLPDREARPHQPWVRLTQATLNSTYQICLSPACARYSDQTGLILGETGNQSSPPRTPPMRPGHSGGLRSETWVQHTRAVRRETAQRALKEIPPGSFAADALLHRYGCGVQSLYAAADFAALMHDFGKLQDRWQEWAHAYMQVKAPGWRAAPLAHTEYDRSDPADRERARRTSELVSRPNHAAAGGYFAAWVADRFLSTVEPGACLPLAAAACAGITAHHGGWIPGPQDPELGIRPLWAAWRPAAVWLGDQDIDPRVLEQAAGCHDKRHCLVQMLEECVGESVLQQRWPLVALITRVLRLSDQKATEEGGGE